MLVSFCYLMLRWFIQLAALRVRSNDFKELEIVVLRHELAILRRRRKRPVLTALDRLFLTAASRCLARERWQSFLITPATLLRWHRLKGAQSLLRRQTILVDYTAKSIAALDTSALPIWKRHPHRLRWRKGQGSMRPVAVVVIVEYTKHLLEMFLV